MKSDLEIVDLLYLGLYVPALTSAITGRVYKWKRPLNSNLIDVVINCLPTNNLQLQTAVANVNIHVPNLSVTLPGGLVDNTQADIPTLRSLTSLVISILKERWFPEDEYWFDVQQQNIFSEDGINEHYSNIRVNFYSINI